MAPRNRKEIDVSTYTGRFAARLKMLREKKKMNIDQLAEAAGVPSRTLYHWEAGNRSPSIENFPELAEALGVTVRTLMPEK